MNIEPKNRVRAAGILLIHDDSEKPSFLLLRHADRWDLPKGHCDRGESFLETALRETEEETGITPEQLRLDPDFCFELNYPVQYPHLGESVLEKQVRYFLGYLSIKPDLILTEHQSSHWFSWSPPHQIQSQTIDPLLAAVAEHLDSPE